MVFSVWKSLENVCLNDLRVISFHNNLNFHVSELYLFLKWKIRGCPLDLVSPHLSLQILGTFKKILSFDWACRNSQGRYARYYSSGSALVIWADLGKDVFRDCSMKVETICWHPYSSPTSLQRAASVRFEEQSSNSHSPTQYVPIVLWLNPVSSLWPTMSLPAIPAS